MSRSANFFLLFLAPALSLYLGLLGLETLNQNLMGWFLLATGVGYPASAIASYSIRKTPLWGISGKALHEEKGDLSFWAVLPGMAGAFFLPPLEYLYMAGTLPRSDEMEYAGMALALSGIALGLWARISLRRQFSGHLQVAAGQMLVMTGPYRWIRHPSYAGFILAALGIAIGYTSLLGLAVIVLLLIPGLVYRMGVEEKILETEFGDQYSDYRRGVRKIIPGIW
jgi:protein-S-isoprenylcysteine O-methyltransferase Ste14